MKFSCVHLEENGSFDPRFLTQVMSTNLECCGSDAALVWMYYSIIFKSYN